MRVRAAVSVAFLAFGLTAQGGEIPARPEILQFPPLQFAVPKPEGMRELLPGKIPVYVAEDHLLPLVTVRLYFRGGKYLEVPGKEGSAQLLGDLWRSGGAATLTPQELDETLDYLAAELNTYVGLTSSSVSLNVLAKDLDAGLKLLFDVVLQPALAEERLAKTREDLLAELKRRNDDTAELEEREWNRLIYGDDYWLNRLPTKASVESIKREDLLDLHRRIVNPANCVVAVAGDVNRKTILASLKRYFVQWQAKPTPVPPVPQPEYKAKPGVYLVNKPDVNQGRVRLGHLAVKRPFVDEFAINVANDILGGRGFVAWMMSRIRSDEGLAYGAYSSFGVGDLYPGTFRAFFQSKSSTCARATQLTLELVAKLRQGQITEKELTTSKNAFIETFPRNFESKLLTVARYAQDELVGRPHSYWLNYRANIAKVDAQGVKQAAERYIRPEDFVILVVGNVDEILKGHPDFPTVQMANFGPLVRVPRRDPLTLEPLPLQSDGGGR